MRWLECLPWPGETGRRERLAAAIETARRDPPVVYRGDLLTGLPGVARRAPAGAGIRAAAAARSVRRARPLAGRRLDLQ